jgi:glucosamine--fructose-6-phosphate aminotransferase (isomerizing)
MSETPELRAGPPWAMQGMIEAEPGLVEPILAAPEIAQARELIAGAQPLVLTGCGTSEHAAMAGAALLGARSRDAFEAALDPQTAGVLIGISHEAGTAATLAALNATDARTILITALPDRAPDGPHVIPTPLRDTSWCHTVGYLSPLLALTALAEAPDPGAVRAALEVDIPELPVADRYLVVGSGVDEITARELSLKIEEGAHVPCTPLGIEKVLHGHLPAADARTGLILLRFDARQNERRDHRGGQVLAAARALEMPSVTLRADPVDGLTPVASALLSGALAAQRLTLQLVMTRKTNPDLIRREEAPYSAAAAAAE